MLNTYNQMIYSYVDKTPLIAIFIFSFVIAKIVVNEKCVVWVEKNYIILSTKFKKGLAHYGNISGAMV